ncbi:MAG: DUF2634 domain-containing protein [Lawsonibacter sp.]
MTPKATTILPGLTVEREAQRPSKTYRVDWTAGRVRGMVDGREAMGQAIRKVLSTQRFAHLIYSWNYGTEWGGLLGADRALAESEIKRILWEALGQDGRVTGLSKVDVTWIDRRSCAVSVEAETTFGAVREEKTVHV